jgi:hypothetical protein
MENTYSKNSSVIPGKFNIYRSCIKSSIEVLKYNLYFWTISRNFNPLPTLNWAVQMPLEAGIIEKKKHLPMKITRIMQD